MYGIGGTGSGAFDDFLMTYRQQVVLNGSFSSCTCDLWGHHATGNNSLPSIILFVSYQ